MSTVWRPQFDGKKCGCVVEDYTTLIESCNLHRDKTVKEIIALNIEETIKDLDETTEKKDEIRQNIYQVYGI